MIYKSISSFEQLFSSDIFTYPLNLPNLTLEI